jgi:ABC-type nitrate/sulfonate/bicarbonate transport system permease component
MIWLDRLIVLAGVLAIWMLEPELQLVPIEYLPRPGAVGRAFVGLVNSGELLHSEILTMTRASVGFAIAIFVGVGLACLGWIERRFRAALRPIVELLRPIPPAALVPITVFALGSKLYLFVVAFVAVWPVYLATEAALAAVPEVLLRTAAAFGCSQPEALWSIAIKHALPQIFVGARISASISLVAVVVAEMLAGRDGLGHLLFQMAFAIRTPEVYALTVLCGLNGMIINQIVNMASGLLIGWKLRMLKEAEA